MAIDTVLARPTILQDMICPVDSQLPLRTSWQVVYPVTHGVDPTQLVRSDIVHPSHS